MKCPKCQAEQLEVYNSRPKPDNSIWRRRRCLKCGKRVTTRERITIEGRDA